MKVRKFLEEHSDHIALQKLKRAEQLTKQDLSELERMFLEEGVTDQETLAELEAEQGLGVFLRSLTGMDRSAAKAAFSTFTTDHKLNGNQTEFLNMVIDYLSDSGIVEPKRFYESPFTDIDDLGIAGVFQKEQAALIIKIVNDLNEAAAA